MMRPIILFRWCSHASACEQFYPCTKRSCRLLVVSRTVTIVRIGQITAKRKQASALQTLARPPTLPDSAERMECSGLPALSDVIRIAIIAMLMNASSNSLRHFRVQSGSKLQHSKRWRDHRRCQISRSVWCAEACFRFREKRLSDIFNRNRPNRPKRQFYTTGSSRYLKRLVTAQTETKTRVVVGMSGGVDSSATA